METPQPQLEQYKKLLEDSKSYLQTRYDLLRLELLDKMSKILGLLILGVLGLFALFVAVAYFSVALVAWMSMYMPTAVACCILGGAFLLIILIAYLLRNVLFINPLLRTLSQILFYEEDEDLDDDVVETKKGGEDDTLS